jgi:hypothetical protein
MSTIGLDFAVRADLRNAPVRELDRARLRRLWAGVAVGALLVALLVATAWLQFRIAALGYQIQQVQQAREQEDHVREHLLLELDTLTSPALLAAQAARLQLEPPEAGATFVIERVPATAPPDGTMVASR